MRTMQCGICLRYRGELTCDAFPRGIPEIILTGEWDHRKSHAGDNDKTFKPLPKILEKSGIPGIEAMVDNINDVFNRDEVAYNRVKDVLKRKGYVDADFERDGALYGYSVNELIDLARGKDG